MAVWLAQRSPEAPARKSIGTAERQGVSTALSPNPLPSPDNQLEQQ
jgi:hypothetical protein